MKWTGCYVGVLSIQKQCPHLYYTNCDIRVHLQNLHLQHLALTTQTTDGPGRSPVKYYLARKVYVKLSWLNQHVVQIKKKIKLSENPFYFSCIPHGLFILYWYLYYSVPISVEREHIVCKKVFFSLIGYVCYIFFLVSPLEKVDMAIRSIPCP